MGGFDHKASADRTFLSEEISSRNARYGGILFFIYLAFYAGFVLLSAFWPQVMDLAIAGVNLAIWYGFALIIVALVLAMLYGWLCRDRGTAEVASKGNQP